MKKIFLIAILSMVLINCSSDDNCESFAPQNIDFETIGKGQITTIINEEGQQNNITVTIATGEHDAGYTTICRPYHIVKIPKSDKPVVFE